MESRLKSAALSALLFAALPSWGTDLAFLQNGFSIRHERREIVGSVTRLYLSTGSNAYVDVPTAEINHFEQDLSPPPPPVADATFTSGFLNPAATTSRPQNLRDLINTVGDRHSIDPALINSVIHAESGFNPRAVSPKGAQGLMQLMPKTASNLGVANALDPADNVEGGTKYLRELLELYNFDLVKALAAYNAGPMRVQHYRGVPPFHETRAYVARVIKDFNRQKMAEKKAAAASTGTAASKKQSAQSATPMPINLTKPK
ncbi:MAG: lytic transglycosylase domain-containing protein [Acidobacteriales bacterium]|nr:lytic transglycosylase domain-containing protein [Terriglobales bacterium]